MTRLNRSQRRRLARVVALIAWLAAAGFIGLSHSYSIVANANGTYDRETRWGMPAFLHIQSSNVTITGPPAANASVDVDVRWGGLALGLAALIGWGGICLLGYDIEVHRRRLGGRCDGCGYPIRTDSARCPECGETIQRDWYRVMHENANWHVRLSLRIDGWIRRHEAIVATVGFGASWLAFVYLLWGVSEKVATSGVLQQAHWGLTQWLTFDRTSPGANGSYSINAFGLTVAIAITLAMTASFFLAWRVSKTRARFRCETCGCDLRESEGDSCPVCGHVSVAPSASR